MGVGGNCRMLVPAPQVTALVNLPDCVIVSAGGPTALES